MKKVVLFARTFLVGSSILFIQTKISANGSPPSSGTKVKICGKISGSRNDNSSPILIYMNNSSGASQLSIVINQEDAKNFPYKPEEFLANKNVCVTGEVSSRNGKAEMVIRKSDNIKVDEGGEVEIRPLSFEGVNRYFREK